MNLRKIVSDLNSDIEETSEYVFVYATDGYEDYVMFNGEFVWRSDENYLLPTEEMMSQYLVRSAQLSVEKASEALGTLLFLLDGE